MIKSSALTCWRNIVLIEDRAVNFQRNELLENLLRQLNADLQPSEQALLERYFGKKSAHPIILVMGPLRSGTTLFMQWLANTGLVAYPSNLLSRFFRAPILGAKIQLLLTDPRFNFRDELWEFGQQVEYASENGKTRGALAPNEFWYFWRRFLQDSSRDCWTDYELQQSMDIQSMKAELAGMVDVFQKPFAAKGMLFNYNIPFFDSIMENVFFIRISRDPVANIASVLDARKRQSGSKQLWYSFKIPEYESLKDMEPLSQAAGQVHYINQAITRGLEGVSETRKMEIKYEDFCESPGKTFAQLAGKLNLKEVAYDGPARFDVTRNSLQDHMLIRQALAEFSNA